MELYKTKIYLEQQQQQQNNKSYNFFKGVKSKQFI
jgi:hypothetical protein